MALVLTEEQEMLQEAAKGFLQGNAPISSFRTLRDSNDPLGWSRQLWKQMAEMGWTGIMIDDPFDGLNFGMTGAAIVCEEMGRNLTASPFLASSIISPVALRAANTKQKKKWLPKLARGERIMALALEEGVKHDPVKTALKAEKKGNGYALNGNKSWVAEGLDCDAYLVLARTSGDVGSTTGLSLFIVEKQLEILEISSQKLLDSRNYANVKFHDVQVTGEDLIGEEGQGLALLEPALNAGRIGLSAEMLGAGMQCFETTISYLKERQQFGQVLGTFQGLQHRAAHMYSELELVKSIVLKAAQDFEVAPEHAGMMASAAKAKAAEVSILVANEGVQMHGGIGMTDEFDMGLYIKRIRAASELLGDYSYHADRFANWRGF